MSKELENFIKFAKEEYGVDVHAIPSESPTTFKGIYGISFTSPACENCPNNIKNGGSGICHCTLGQIPFC